MSPEIGAILLALIALGCACASLYYGWKSQKYADEAIKKAKEAIELRKEAIRLMEMRK